MMLPFRSKIFEFTDNESPYIQIKQYIYIYIYREREREREKERERENFLLPTTVFNFMSLLINYSILKFHIYEY